jgi:hypothetical protein
MRYHAIRTLAFLLFTAAAAGCAVAQVPPAGQLDVALTAAGAGGVTYRLPPGTDLQVSSDTVFDQFTLDGDTSSLTFDLPPGNYAVSLVHRPRFTTTWPLTRTSPDGTTDTVPATLDPIANVTVTENQTVPLALRFHVAVAETITFVHGSAHVFVDVGETTATAYQLDLDAPGLTDTASAVTPAAPPELGPRMPAVGTTSEHLMLSAKTVSPWQIMDSQTLCADAQVSVYALVGSPGLADLVKESFLSSGLCIFQVDATTAEISVVMQRIGPATTPTFTDLGDRKYSMITFPVADVNALVHDGTTVHLGALQGTHPANVTLSGAVNATDVGGTGSFSHWYSSTTTGSGTTTFTPL